MKYDELITIGPNEVVETRPFPPFLPTNTALCQMLGCSPYESCLAPIICMVGAILFAQK
ncbi:hypothetical protein [Veillonella caviae]|uniref:hypothetical protein n=1 Tax=Veillonella caviae TaxID=248316 RepID=UPI0023F84DF9|nr:hypothetical protein [Veillonella caviae]MCI7693792.1 hypothetical protein [Veillonella caviae]MDY5254639.1 hypothetical protein [Veillonella caviae]